LSDKYDVSILRDIMISVLSDLDPNSLDKWNERKRPPLAGYSSYYADHVRVLNLVVKLDIRAIQPVVIYQICTSLELDWIVEGEGNLRIENEEFRKRCILGYSRL
jgi:hypothetical protein